MERRGKIALLLAAAVLLPVLLPAKRFYRDDPVHAEPPPMNVKDVLKRKFSDYFDFVVSSFGNPAQTDLKAPVPRAQALNTLDEAMDSTWWQRRHYYKPMTIEELTRGTGGKQPPSFEGHWEVIRAKNEGITPGFTIRDSKKHTYFVKFDPLEHPEIATAPDVLVSNLFYALGYNVPDNYVIEFDPKILVVAEGTLLEDQLGQQRPMTDRDVTEILMKAPKTRDGKYRAVASLSLTGSPRGPFRFWGTRKDDPNDIVPHEHRRDLRGLWVASAWVNHDDSRAINTLDTLVTEGDRKFIRHHLIDFGSTLGSATSKPNSPRSGFEYMWSFKPALAQFASLGLYVPGWARAKYPDYSSAGRFEYERFDPLKWKPEYPNPAFMNCRPDDAFWMAKQIMAFTDEQISAIVKSGKYSDPRTEAWIIECLIKRRDKIGRAHFSQVLPLDKFNVVDGRLTFENLAAKYGFEKEPAYQVRWTIFDNEKETHHDLPAENSLRIPQADQDYIAATIQGSDAAKKVVVYLRANGGTRSVVGIERLW